MKKKIGLNVNFFKNIKYYYVQVRRLCKKSNFKHINTKQTYLNRIAICLNQNEEDFPSRLPPFWENRRAIDRS